jgi:hypothetical protein
LQRESGGKVKNLLGKKQKQNTKEEKSTAKSSQKFLL